MLWDIYMSKFGVSGKLGEWEEQMQGVEFELDGETDVIGSAGGVVEETLSEGNSD
jgi:hypothetical protein